jgi:hypothetical protein
VVPLKNPVESPVVFVRNKYVVHHGCLYLHNQMMFQNGNLGSTQDHPPLWKPLSKKTKVPEKTEINGHLVEKPPLQETLGMDSTAPQNSGPQWTRIGSKVVKGDLLNLKWRLKELVRL